MVQYQYNGEHHRVSIEGISFIKGEVTTLTEGDEKILLNSGFGKAMIESGEFIKVDNQETTKRNKKTKGPETEGSELGVVDVSDAPPLAVLK